MMTAPEFPGNVARYLVYHSEGRIKSSWMHVYRCYKTDAGINRLNWRRSASFSLCHSCMILLAGYRKSFLWMSKIFKPGQCCRIYVQRKETSIGRFHYWEKRKRLSQSMLDNSVFARVPDVLQQKDWTTDKTGDPLHNKKIFKGGEHTVPGIIGALYTRIECVTAKPHLVNNGVNIYNVRDFLGHESVATTRFIWQILRLSERQSSRWLRKPFQSDFFQTRKKDDLLNFLDSLE